MENNNVASGAIVVLGALVGSVAGGTIGALAGSLIGYAISEAKKREEQK